MILPLKMQISEIKNANSEMIWFDCEMHPHSMARANLKKVNTSQLLLPQHQNTYPRGPESASIKIPPFRPKFILSKCTSKCEHCETRFT